MGKCVYQWNNQSFDTKEALKEALRGEFAAKEKILDKNSFVITGEAEDLSIDEMVLREESIQQFGTDEHIGTEIKGNQLFVIIDPNAITDLVSNERLLFNSDTNKLESFNIESLIAQEGQNLPIPNIRNWQLEKTQFFAQKVLDSIQNAKPAPPQNQPDLRERLYSFAQRLGIKVDTLENWMAENAFRINGSEDISALSDMLTKTIALSNSENLDDLVEETAHFAVEWAKDSEVMNRMLAAVDQTNTYKAEAENYRAKYSKQPKSDGTFLTKEEVSRKVRKEILGKILAEKIKDNFNENAQNSAEVGIFTQLKDLWNRFKALFVITNENQKFFSEFGSVLDDLAADVIEGDVKKFVPWESKEIYFSLDPQQKLIHDNLTDVIKRYKESYRNTIKQGATKGIKQSDLSEIEDNLALHQYGLVVNSVVGLLQQDVDNATNLVNKAKEQDGNFVDNVNITSVANVVQFVNNFDIHSTLLKNELDNLLRLVNNGILDKSAITKEQVQVLKNRLRAIGKQYGDINGDIQELASHYGREALRKVYTEMGAPQDVVEEILSIFDGNNFKNINWLQEWIYPLSGISNPLFEALNAMIVVAESLRKKIAREFGEKLSEIIRRNNISDNDAKWLINRRTRNGLKQEVIENFFDIKKEEYDDKIDALDTKISKETDKTKRRGLQQQRVALVAEKAKALEAQLREWTESPVSEDQLRKMDALSKQAQNAILDRSARKKKILDKYRLKSTGEVPVQNISNADWNDLYAIESAYKEKMSTNHPDGSLKEGAGLQTALDLLKYRDEVIKNNSDITYDYKDFKNNVLEFIAEDSGKKFSDLNKDISENDEKEVIIEKLNKIIQDNWSPKLQKWLSQNAIYTYDEKTRSYIDEGGGIMVDTEEMPPLTESTTKDILRNLNIRYREEYTDEKGKKRFRILTSLPNPSNPTSPENYQAIYESLLAKRDGLIAPYKVQGKPGEIDGAAVPQQVVNSINVVNSQLKNFKLLENLDITIQFEGNDSFERRIAELQGNENELLNFKHEAQVDRNGVPHAYHFRRSRVGDVDKNKFPKVYQPNFKWQANEGQKSFLNPKYNRSVAGKTIQLKLDNPRLKEKVSKEILDKLKAKYVDVKDEMTYGDLFIDNEFFDRFGIDRKTDFWGEKGATKNKDLWELREFILTEKAKTDKEYGTVNNLFNLPQVVGRAKELLDKGIKDSGRAWLSREFLDENDDAVSGDRNRITVPKRFIKKIDNPNLLTEDIGFMFGKYVEAGVNYREKNRVVPEIQLLVEKLKNSTIGKAPTASATSLYKMMDKWLSVHLYGNLIDEVEWMEDVKNNVADVGENLLPKSAEPYVGTFRKISSAKFLHFIYSYFQKVGLGLSNIIPVVNWVNSATNTTMEHLSENQVSRESLTWSAEMTTRHGLQHLADSGTISPKTKVVKLLRYASMYFTPEKIFEGVSKNVLFRSVDDPLFVTYRPFSVAIAAHSAFSIFDSYRLVDGEFININTFRDKKRAQETKITDAELRKQWSELRPKSYYNFLKETGENKVTKEVGKISLDLSKLESEGYFQGLKKEEKERKIELLESKMMVNAQQFQARIEAQTVSTDNALLFSNPGLQFLGIFSKYFFNFLYHRFGAKKYNVIQNRIEEGNYRTMAKLTKDILTNDTLPFTKKMEAFFNLYASAVTFGAYSTGLKDLKEEYQRSNVRRAGIDVSMYLATMAFFLLMNSAADDDDNGDEQLKQYLALISTRALVELGSSSFIGAGGDIIKRLESPIAGLSMLEDFMNIPMLFSSEGAKEITRGRYEGLTKRQKTLLQLSFLRNMYSGYYSPNFRQQNMYFRSNVLVKANSFLEEEEEK